MQKHDHYEHYAESDSSPEATRIQPRIYVASLSDYNEGRLHGRWLDAAQDVESLSGDVATMLRASPGPGAEEYAIHDHEGFGGYRVDEFDSLATVSALARGIVSHGPAYGELASLIGGTTLAAEPQRFEQSYLGAWSSLDAFVHEMAEDFGWEDQLDVLPSSLRPYVHVDYQQLARDVQIELVVTAHAEGVWVFDPRQW